MTEQRRGFLLGAAAYAMWGLFPLYWPLLEPAGAVEILAHRVCWSLLTMLALTFLLRRTPQLRAIFRDRRLLLILGAASVVIGKPARRVARARAMEHVAGYTIANDYAVRDYLENWYRPNLRVKNRDGATVLGPWLVDASEVEAPPQRALRTFVNGRQTQSGHTRGQRSTGPADIRYLSAFMTLGPGDVILTGTPEGVVDVAVGDEVACEIEGLGRLVNRIVGDDVFGRPSDGERAGG